MSLIPNTYNGLVSGVKALAEDDSQEFINYIPTAIFLTEEAILKEMDTDGAVETTTLALTCGTNTVGKPSGHRLTHEVRLTTSAGTTTFLSQKRNDYIRDYWPNATSVDKPKYYGNDDKDNFVVAPTPSSAYSLSVQYEKQVTHLSASNQTNYFTNFCPDALFYGTMSKMSEFMKDYSIKAVWDAEYLRAMTALNNEGRRDRRDDGNTPMYPQGTNSLTTEK